MTLPRMRVQRADTEVQVPAARLDLEPSRGHGQGGADGLPSPSPQVELVGFHNRRHLPPSGAAGQARGEEDRQVHAAQEDPALAESDLAYAAGVSPNDR
jgi:hypothetical protein